MESMTEERFIAKRAIKLAYIGVMTLLSGAALGAAHRLPLGDAIALVFLDVLFAVLFIFYLESCRMHKKGRPDSAEDYQQVCSCYTAGLVGMLAVSFLPEYTVPALMAAVLLSAGLDREQAAVVAVFLDSQLALSGRAGVYPMACYLMLMLLGIVLASMYGQKAYRMYAEMAALALSIAVPALFYYMEYGTPPVLMFLFWFLDGVVTVAGMHFLYDFLHFRLENFGEISLDTIVDPNFHLVREIKKYSKVDYGHAIRVSRIAAHCAAHIGADVKLSAVGGFYYRLGKLGGEPFIENGVIIAQNNCFPNGIISILSEYDGEKAAISTIESAIVHITDTLVTKFELLDHTTLSSSWNRDMVIYQTLNEKSSEGVYDSSGLTMNQFLKIREFLAKEEELL